MALTLLFSPQFTDNLEAILRYYDTRNGNDRFSKKLLKTILAKLTLLKSMPEIGRKTDFPRVRLLFVEHYVIVYQIRDDSVLVIDISSGRTRPGTIVFEKA